MLKDKKYVFIFLAVALLVGLATTWYYKNICSTGICSYQVIIGVIAPLEKGSYILATFFTAFFFLPYHYFNAWFKYIFSWAFPLSLLLVAVTSDGGGVMSFSRALVVQMHGVFFGGLTVLFILYHFYKTQKQK